MAATEIRDVDVIRSMGRRYWSELIIRDPAMVAGVDFLDVLISNMRQNSEVDLKGFREVVSAGSVLIPSDASF